MRIRCLAGVACLLPTTFCARQTQAHKPLASAENNEEPCALGSP
jgi:hypothetical protein